MLVYYVDLYDKNDGFLCNSIFEYFLRNQYNDVYKKMVSVGIDPFNIFS